MRKQSSEIAVLDEVWKSFLSAARREYELSLSWAEAQFPHFTEKTRWRLLPVDARSGWLADDTYEHGNWTAGFWFGVMWLLAVGTEDSEVASYARGRLERLAVRASDSTTHDLGFIFFPSYVLGHSVGCVSQADTAPAIAAARMMAQRFNARGGYIQAFGPIGDNRSAGTSTIDTMVNLPLLWWAAQSNDCALFDVARRHARTSSRLFLREDGSTYHLNLFDPISGALLHRGTFQGAREESCWSRGQAWAITGLAWSFAATGETEFLAAAERAARYFWEKVPPDGLPPWDFSDAAPDAPRDASASAIAALGALVLGGVHPKRQERDRYDAEGKELLLAVSKSALNSDEGRAGILLRSCYSKPHNLGIDSAVAWGDFYLGLALAIAVGRISLAQTFGFSPLVKF